MMSTVTSTAHAPCADNVGQQILDAACHLITNQGFAGMSMRSLAKVVGLHAGSLYYHFPSKQELLEEVLDHLQQQRFDAWRREKPKYRSALPMLEGFIRFNVQRQLYSASEERLLKTELCHLDAVQQHRIMQQELRYTEEVKTILIRGIREGVFKKIDADVFAHGILGLTSCTLALKQLRDLPEQHLARLVSGMVHQLLSLTGAHA